MHDYIAVRLLQARREDIERTARHPRLPRPERSWRALATAHAVRFGLTRAALGVGDRRPAPNES